VNFVSRIQPRHGAAGAALGSAVFFGALLAPQRFDPSALVNAGRALSDASAVPPGLRVIREGDGYDGQFSYRLALYPLTNERTADGLSLDLPAYRQQRILYPLLGWVLSVGYAPLLPTALLLINAAGIPALAWLTARFATLHGRAPLWGLALAMFPASFIALANDLSEILLAACLVGVAVALERRWPALTALSLSLVVLAHEHGLVLVLAVALVTLSSTELRTRGWLWTWLIPLTIFIGWQVYLTIVWGEAPIRVAVGYLNEPLRGFVSIGRRMVPPRTVSEALHLGGFAYVLMFSSACVWALRTTAAHRALCLGWVFATSLLFLGTGVVWEAELSFWRAATAALTLGSLVLIGSRARVASAALLMGMGFGLVMAARLVLTAWHA
jgi:hypothetical protein